MDEDSESDSNDENEQSSSSENSENEDANDSGDHMTATASTSRGEPNIRGTRFRGRDSAAGNRALSRGEINQLWSENDVYTRPEIPEFTAVPGVKADIQPEDSALSFFQLFIDNECIEQMVEQTNLYASQVIDGRGESLKENSLLNGWKEVSVSEMKTFLGLLFAMGLVQKPEIKSYWSTNPILATPFFNDSMSRNRFESILMAFHLNDNSKNLPRQHPDHDKIFKIRPLFDTLQERFGQVVEPHQQLAVDESMMPWRGRVEFRMFIPSKPIRYGLKMYMCCESTTSYVTKMEIYTGKKGQKREVDHGPNVVKRMVSDFAYKGYTVYIDSFFSSVQLVEDLRKEGTTVCGTIRKDRRGKYESLLFHFPSFEISLSHLLLF